MSIVIIIIIIIIISCYYCFIKVKNLCLAGVPLHTQMLKLSLVIIVKLFNADLNMSVIYP